MSRKSRQRNASQRANLQRAVDQAILSRQPRFINEQNFYSSMLELRDDSLIPPPLSTNTRVRDEWLAKFWKLNGHIAGSVNTVVSLKANQRWSMTGGRNQVARFSNVLHSAENGQGWRYFISRAATAFFTSDLGSVTEIGRSGPTERDPLQGLFNVDSTRMRLTGDPEFPLVYSPFTGDNQAWADWFFFKITSMPSYLEKDLGLGYCALSRAIEFVKIMIAVFDHHKDKLASTSMAGFATLKGMTQKQFQESLEKRRQDMKANPSTVSKVMVLASPTADIELKMIALSELPENFTLSEFTQFVMRGIALCFNVDVQELYPDNSGPLGTATQAAVQDAKSTAKIEQDFSISIQEQIQNLLPTSLWFNFDPRDDDGRLVKANTDQAVVSTAIQLYNAGRTTEDPLFTKDQILHYLLTERVISEEMISAGQVAPTGTPTDPTNNETDVKNQEDTERFTKLPWVERAARLWPDEPLIRRWSDGTQEVLVRRMGTLVKRTFSVREATNTFDYDKALTFAKDVNPEIASMLEADVI